MSPRSSTIPLLAPRDGSEEVLAALIRVPAVAVELGTRFAGAGFALHLVGGSVRDALLGRRTPSPDLDFATDATPGQVQALVRGWAQDVWDVGIEFGTVGLQRGGARLEVTTYRSEHYDPGSRNPAVEFGQSLSGDLRRRDFTVNAMAVSLPGQEFADPFGGVADLAAGILRTPAPAVESFSDDPLRMMRAARFAAALGLRPAPDVVAAMEQLAPRLAIVAPERVRDELVKLLLSPDPVTGLELFVDTGLAAVVLPELPALRLTQDEHGRHKDVYRHSLTVLEQSIALEPRLPGGGPDLIGRLAALLHDIGKPATKEVLGRGKVSFHNHEVVGARLVRSRLKALRFPKDTVEAVTLLVRLHLRFHGYGEGAWTDKAVRHYVTDAGPLLTRLHVLTRSDCTTRNAARAARLSAAYDDLETRIARLAEQEELDRIRPDIDGTDVMAILDLPPGPTVGAAMRHLLELRMEHGPQSRETVVAQLLDWAAGQGLTPPG